MFWAWFSDVGETVKSARSVFYSVAGFRLQKSSEAASLARCLVIKRLDTRRIDKMCVYELHPTPAVVYGFGNDCCVPVAARMPCKIQNTCISPLSPLSPLFVACRPLANRSSCKMFLVGSALHRLEHEEGGKIPPWFPHSYRLFYRHTPSELADPPPAVPGDPDSEPHWDVTSVAARPP